MEEEELTAEAERLEAGGRIHCAPATASSGAPSLCATCGGPGSLKCGRCKAVSYCGPDCQRADWKREGGHKGACVPVVAAGGGGRAASLAALPAALPALPLSNLPDAASAAPPLSNLPACESKDAATGGRVAALTPAAAATAVAASGAASLPPPLSKLPDVAAAALVAGCGLMRSRR